MESLRPYPTASSEQRTRVIVVLDVVESVRLMEGDEQGFIRRWQAFVREVRDQVMPAFGGRIHKSTGDGLMLEFAGASDAIAAAFELLRLADSGNAGRAPHERIELRIAAHVARFVADEFDIYGCGVNLTSRLLGVAGPGELCITAALRELLEDGAARRMEDTGTHQLRHLSEPVQVYRVTPPAAVTSGPAACA
jgi:class 3 adenylate cyclase